VVWWLWIAEPASARHKMVNRMRFSPGLTRSRSVSPGIHRVSRCDSGITGAGAGWGISFGGLDPMSTVRSVGQRRSSCATRSAPLRHSVGSTAS